MYKSYKQPAKFRTKTKVTKQAASPKAKVTFEKGLNSFRTNLRNSGTAILKKKKKKTRLAIGQSSILQNLQQQVQDLAVCSREKLHPPKSKMAEISICGEKSAKNRKILDKFVFP